MLALSDSQDIQDFDQAKCEVRLLKNNEEDDDEDIDDVICLFFRRLSGDHLLFLNIFKEIKEDLNSLLDCEYETN